MKDNHAISESDDSERTAIEAAWERCAAPHLRDVLKREHDEAQKRPHDVAWEKWGPKIQDAIERDFERMKKHPSHPAPTPLPEMDGSDLEME